MRLEQALREYKKRKKEEERRIRKLKERYNKRVKKKIKEILKKIEKLEKKRLPKDVDGQVARLVENDRRNYVRALRHALESVGDIEDLGKRLPDLAKLHVGHGKYLLLVFEKDIYAINRLLKELSEDYAEYYAEALANGLSDVDPERLLEEEQQVQKILKETRKERDKLRKAADKKRDELQEFYRDRGLDKLEEEITSLSAEVRRIELEVRSKASKLHKPIKRMRLGGFADKFLKDSGVAIENPDEFLTLMKRVLNDLDDKHRKVANWLIKNLPERVMTINERRRELEQLQEKKDRILEEGANKEKEIWEIERKVEEKEAEIKKLRHQLEHLEAQLNTTLSRIEEILGEKIER